MTSVTEVELSVEQFELEVELHWNDWKYWNCNLHSCTVHKIILFLIKVWDWVSDWESDWVWLCLWVWVWERVKICQKAKL